MTGLDLSVWGDEVFNIDQVGLAQTLTFAVNKIRLLFQLGQKGSGFLITTAQVSHDFFDGEDYLNPTVLSVMREWKREQARYLLAQGYPREGYCFTRENGKVLNPQAPTSYLARFGKKYGIQNLHPHALRHTMATISIANGADIVSVSEKLGHSETSVTLDVYSHVNKKAQKRANQILSQALYTPQNESKMQA